MRHVLGAASDDLIHEETDARFSLGLGKSRSERFLYIGLHSAITSEVRYAPADDPEAAFQIILPREHDVEYGVEHHGDYFYIRTSKGARNFRLMRRLADSPSERDWEEVLPERPGVTIERIDAFESHLVVHERDRGLPRIRVGRAGDPADHYYVEFPEPAYSVFAAGNAEYRTNILRFTYTSLVTPPSVFDFNMDTRERELKKQTEVLGGYDAALYSSERIFATAPDGLEIPVSIVYRKDTPRQGASPMLLYGYGSYGACMDPGFSSDRLSLLDRGFVYGIAHVRGGGELGKSGMTMANC